ncbi:MAG: 2-amino-4-hydroxy-6-hydroxymethyldihydropteridine diphosphokinase [candidate division Zixibacteria bacterium]|nr:2-amino-4-hydroxy-6-hydroxymethyldihydropteridine diphosphokinase [candidate division Zixibacteria bacterium]
MVYLGLGANLGDRLENIKKALTLLNNKPGITLIRTSSLYLTEPIGVSRQPDFYNGVAEIKTTLSPQSLLKVVKAIEYDMGRQPDSHFQPRPIDIDILMYGDLEIDSLDLRVPHSRLDKRAFVLIPLLELNPDLLHPISFKPLKEYLAKIDDSQKVERVIDAGDITEQSEEG